MRRTDETDARGLRSGLRPGEIIVDSFAGGGGASEGIRIALGHGPHIAINHDDEAITLHRANHPETTHYVESVWKVDPVTACAGRPVGLMWLSPDCFPAGTLVLTRRGYRPIETVEEGERVLTHRNRWRPVTARMVGDKSTLTIRVQGHPGVTCSTGHKFWARASRHAAPEWIPANQLTRAAYLAAPKFVESVALPGMHRAHTAPRFWWIVGRYLADGWASATHGLILTVGAAKAEATAAVLEASGLDWKRRETATAVQFAHYDASLCRWLERHFGKGAGGKVLPGWVLSLLESDRRELLAGYVAGDGFVRDGLTEVSSGSPALAYGIRSLAETLGNTCRVYRGTNRDTQIDGRTVRAKLAMYKVRWRAHVDVTHRQTVEDEMHRWYRVREITPGDTQPVFNITVDEDHSYVVEGIVAKNCKHFSKAKGGKPVSPRVRGLAWVAVRWAAAVKPRIMILENVEEFQTWGPVLLKHTHGCTGDHPLKVTERDGAEPERGCLPKCGYGRPCPDRKGQTFRAFKRKLERLGYVVEHRELRASRFDTPTIRKRLFIVMRCDGEPIVWPTPTHGPGLLPYRTAAECIDWSLPCPSIFERARPLKENTLKRIGRGIKRFVIDAPKPFIVEIQNSTWGGKPIDIDTPMRTVTAHPKGGGHALVTPLIAGVGGRAGQSPERPLTKPYQTITAKADAVIVTPVIAPITHHGESRGSRADEPLPTVTGAHRGEQAIIAPVLVNTANGKTTGRGPNTWPAEQPLRTVTQKPGFTVVAPVLVGAGGPAFSGKPTAVDRPLGAQTTENHKAVVTPVLVPRYGERPERWRCAACSHEYERADLPVCGCVKCGSADDPELVPGQEPRSRSVNEPLPTIVPTGNGASLVAPILVQTAHGEQDKTGKKRGQGEHTTDAPMGTVLGTGNHSLCAALIAKHFGDNGQRPGSALDEPLATVTARDHNALVASHLVKLRGTSKDGQPTDEPLHTISAGGLHHAEVRAFMIAYFGNEKDGGSLHDPVRTVTSRDRFGLVTVEGQDYVIVDIGMRMLSPRELYRAQGFRDSYLIDIPYRNPKTGKMRRMTKTAQVRMVGNSVCPPLAAAIVRANLGVSQETEDTHDTPDAEVAA